MVRDLDGREEICKHDSMSEISAICSKRTKRKDFIDTAMDESILGRVLFRTAKRGCLP